MNRQIETVKITKLAVDYYMKLWFKRQSFTQTFIGDLKYLKKRLKERTKSKNLLSVFKEV